MQRDGSLFSFLYFFSFSPPFYVYIYINYANPYLPGSRGGKRSVTHLSKAQLTRKRANDREAQRNIRQRNKEHVGALERQIALLQKQEEDWDVQVKELQDGLRLEYNQRVKLEDENKVLRAQLGQSEQTGQAVPLAVRHSVQQDEQVLSIVQEGVLITKYPETWVQVPPEDMSVSTYPATDQIYAATMAYDESEASQQLYTTTADPMWVDSVAYTQVSQALIKPVPAWTPFETNMTQPTRYSFSPVESTHLYANASSWPAQPSPSWQSGTKIKPPTTHIDHLVMSIIDAQRQLVTAGGQLPSLDIPPVQALINQPSPARLAPKLAKIMAGYNSLLSTRGFAHLPERLASFIVMYRFIQFLISPSPSTFKALYPWQRPQPSQLTVPHPAWMDFPPWPAFRDVLIAAQHRYDTPEFHADYAANLSVNFPHDPAAAVVLVDGQVRISECMARHLRDVENASMRRPFAVKYPEFRDVCRFDEV